jgi:molecular chaperone DnaK
MFSTIVPRNSVIPVSRSEVYTTLSDNQEIVEIEIFQGDNTIAQENVPLGSFRIEGLPSRPAGEVQVEVHFDFDLNGILTVTATEKSEGKQGALVVNDATSRRLDSHELQQSRAEIESLFNRGGPVSLSNEELLHLANQALETLEGEATEPLCSLLTQVEEALAAEESERISSLLAELSELLHGLGPEKLE